MVRRAIVFRRSAADRQLASGPNAHKDKLNLSRLPAALTNPSLLDGYGVVIMTELNRNHVVDLLNRILEAELAGVVRYTHYSFLVYGYNRIPVVSWLREQASESLLHAQQAGEMITHLGAYPSLTIGPLLDNHQHDIGAIMRESLETEGRALALYKELLTVVEGHSVMLEEYARQMVYAEEQHAGEVDKMLRKPGELATFQSGAR
jgi:bacterioferritin